ncbi:unnamed protein product [Cylindrotheca closterium]|uniref:DUF6824 domain-containing protein n=1 Tax=Cylindrotheca closterium TaxID=2856 RepID=A0AAD2GAL9_9STRA|nr:unnamed protein product [Cylindrotheca closterium]
MVVTSVVHWVREQACGGGGGFVKELNDGIWYEVGDHLAREKVGQSLREQLHSQYKSSAKAKRQRKKEEQTAQTQPQQTTKSAELKPHQQQEQEEQQSYSTVLDQMVRSNNRINQTMQAVQFVTYNLPAEESSDDLLLRLFELSNANILQTISSDAKLQQGILQLTSTFSC